MENYNTTHQISFLQHKKFQNVSKGEIEIEEMTPSEGRQKQVYNFKKALDTIALVMIGSIEVDGCVNILEGDAVRSDSETNIDANSQVSAEVHADGAVAATMENINRKLGSETSKATCVWIQETIDYTI